MNKNFIRLIVVLEFATVFTSQLSWALLPASSLKDVKASVVCQDFCKQFIPDGLTEDNVKNKIAAGLVSSSPWSADDDKLCVQLGQATTTAYAAVPTPRSDFTGDTACNNVVITEDVYKKVTSMNGVGTDHSRICIEAGKLRDQCYYHNSQVETQCLAYAAITGLQKNGSGTTSNSMSSAKYNDTALLAADFGAAAICTAACTTANPVVIGFCAAASMAAGTAELTMTIRQKSGPLGQLIASQSKMTEKDYVTAVGGGVGAAGGLGMGASLAQNLWNGSGSNAGKVAANTAEEAGSAAKPTTPQNNSLQNQARMACMSAAIFAVLGGVRTNALIEMNQAEDEACKSINSLFSQGTATTTPTSNVANYGTNGGTSDSSSTSSTSASGSGGSTGTSGISSSQLSTLASCLQKTQCLNQSPAPTECTASYCEAQAGISRQTTASTDANLFAPNSTPGALLKPLGNLDDFVKKATTEGAGAAMASILPSSANGNLASALSTIAATAQKEAPSLAGALHLGSTYASGGGPLGNRGRDSNSNDSFNSLFANSGAGGGMMMGGAPSLTTFGDTPVVDDIFHTGSKRSLFQIVSEKTWGVSNRVEKLDPRPFDPRE